jgi:hypothetical protein
MKLPLALILLLTTVYAQDDFNQSIAKVFSNLRDLEDYCAYRKNDFCSKKQMEMSLLILKLKIAEIKIKHDREQEKLKHAEKLRRLRRRNEMKMRAVLRERFMDRYF